MRVFLYNDSGDVFWEQCAQNTDVMDSIAQNLLFEHSLFKKRIDILSRKIVKRFAMGEKSQQKRKYIIEKARQVFIEKGYRNVTMKDIIEACEISRGGLYLYFPGTQEIFLEVLKQEAEIGDDVFSTQATEDATPVDILMLFFAAQKAELLHTRDNLAMAIYEYSFAHKMEGKDNFLREQFKAAVHALTQLIEMGVEDGELFCEEPKDSAEQIMYAIEGLKISQLTMQITEAEIDKQLNYLMQSLGLAAEI